MTNRSNVPDREEIRQLPRWAQVAFAARCARRVQPLFVANWPDTPNKHIDAVKNAITIAEKAAARAAADAVARAAADAADVARAAATALTDAAHAADAARAAAAAARAADAESAADDAHTAAIAAARADARGAAIRAALAAYYKTNGNEVILAIRRDFDILVKSAKENNWNANTPVGPEVFGPFWPDGAPPNWPGEKNCEGCQLVLEIEVPDNASDAQVRAIVLELIDRADDYHRAMGGHGLKIETSEMYGDVPIEVGVGS